MINKIEVMARKESWSKGVSIHMRDGGSIASPAMFRPADEGAVASPLVTLSIQSAQQLMDELWHCGLRPSEGVGSAGSLRATEYHLSDMRAIAFKEAGIEPRE